MHLFRLNMNVTSDLSGSQGGETPKQGTNDVPLLMMIMMMILIANPNVRTSYELRRSNFETNSPQNSIILMVFTLGSASMVVNTVLRSFFMDPVAKLI